MARILQRIKIEKIGYGGVGLARMSDGKRIIIKGGALPGSIVDLRVVKQRKDYIETHITQIHQHDTTLVDSQPFCPHFFWRENSEEGNDTHAPIRKIGCGGCKWQMMSYEKQLALKQDIVLDAVKKLKNPDLTILPIVGSPLEKGYRNKIEFSFGKYITNVERLKGGEVDGGDNNSPQDILLKDSDSNKPKLNVLSDRSVGFHKQGEFSKIVDIENCGLISEQANMIFSHIRKLCFESGLPVYDQKTHQGFFRHLVIREGVHTQQFLVNLSVSEDNLKQNKTDKRDTFLATLQKDEWLQKVVTTFVITYNNGLADTIKSDKSETKTFRGDGYMHEKLIFQNDNKESSEVSFRVSPFSFFQTNTLGAEQLFSLAMAMAGHIEGTILDLYCGTGSIGLSFLKAGKGDKLIGIEIVPEAIVDAQLNAKINGLEKQVFFVAGQAEKVLSENNEFQGRLKDLDLIIVDPPRDGLHKNVVNFLGNYKKERDFKLLYISCNPITMVRDILLLQEYGFGIKTLQPVDMFPQTHHIEVIGLLA